MTNNELALPAGGALVRKPRTNLLAVPTSALRPVAKRHEKFRLAVDRKWLAAAHKGTENAVMYGAAGDLMVGIFGLLFAYMLTATGAAEGAMPVAVGALAAAQIYWVTPGLFRVRWSRGRKRNFEAFLLWAKQRYGIVLAEAQEIPAFIEASGNGATLTFSTAEGEVCTLHRGDQGIWISRGAADDPRSQQEYPLLREAAAIEQRGDVIEALPQDMREVYELVQRRLALLGERQLSPEGEYTSARAAIDSANVLALYGNLLELNAVTEEQQSDVRKVLNQLRVELDELLQRETASAIKALAVESAYVMSREVKPGIRLQEELER